MFRLYSSLVVIVFAMLASACSSIVPLRSPLSQPPLIEKSLIPVAILYSENLRNHKCILDKGYIAETWTMSLGPPSMEMFNLIFATTFENVLVMGSNSNAFSAARPMNIIEVSLLKYDACEAGWPIIGARIEVAYEAILRDTDGVTIARWEGHGQAGPEDNLESYAVDVPMIKVETRYLSAVTGIAMRRAAADFIINFDKDAEIRTWLGK